MKQPRVRAINQLIIASVLWSSAGFLIKAAHVHALAVGGARAGIAALVVLIYLRGKKFRLSKFHILGAIMYAMNSLLFVLANKLTTSSNAIFLQYTAPIWVALFSFWFLKERIHFSDWLAIGFVTVGMFLFFFGEIDAGHLIGNIVAVISGIGMAGFVIVAKLDPEADSVLYVLLGNLLCFVICLPFLVTSFPMLDFKTGLVFVILGVFQLGIPYILYAKAIPVVSPLEAILITILEPILNPIWVCLFSGEAPSLWALIGGSIVLGTVVIRGIYQSLVNQPSTPEDQVYMCRK